MKIHDKIRFSTVLSLAAAPLILNSLAAAETSSISSRSAFRKFKAESSLAPVLIPKGQYVGELQEKWQFPSDHLPIGMSFEGLGIASWNVMNTIYFKWVEENSQGLSRSMLAQENVLLPNSSLTLREKHTVDQVLEMVSQPRSLIALQECGTAFLEELGNRLPSHFKMILQDMKGAKDQNVVLYDTRILELESSQVPRIFSEDKRGFQELIFKRLDQGTRLRIYNAHLPGDPAGPGRFEFGSYVAASQTDGIPTIAMGDMNFNELEMDEAFRKMTPGSYEILTPYCTNISPNTFISKAIDHFILLNTSDKGQISRPEELLEGLDEIAALLETR